MRGTIYRVSKFYVVPSSCVSVCVRIDLHVSKTLFKVAENEMVLVLVHKVSVMRDLECEWV